MIFLVIIIILLLLFTLFPNSKDYYNGHLLRPNPSTAFIINSYITSPSNIVTPSYKYKRMSRLPYFYPYKNDNYDINGLRTACKNRYGSPISCYPNKISIYETGNTQDLSILYN